MMLRSLFILFCHFLYYTCQAFSLRWLPRSDPIKNKSINIGIMQYAEVLGERGKPAHILNDKSTGMQQAC